MTINVDVLMKEAFILQFHNVMYYCHVEDISNTQAKYEN